MSGRKKLLLFVLLLLSVAVRAAFFYYETLDYLNFLSRWVSYFRRSGGFAALSGSIGNYNIPYLYFLALFSYLDVSDLYLIKGLSCLFDYLMAYAAYRIVRTATESENAPWVAFFVVVFAPTVVINSALWAQCDSIYVGMALLGISLALDDHPAWSMVCMAVSFAFKLQAVFILPVCVILLFMGKTRPVYFLLFPLTYMLLILPAVALGRPVRDAVMLYLDQMDTVGSAANYNAPSLNAVTNSDGSALAAFTAMALLLALAFVLRKKLDTRSFLILSVLMVTIIPFLLPHMHDRYFYSADVLSIVLACSLSGTSWELPFAAAYTALLQQFASLICYLAYLTTFYLPLGNIYLTNDRGAIAVLFCLIIDGVLLFTYLTASGTSTQMDSEISSTPGSVSPA